MLTNRLPEILAEQGISIRQLSRMTGITYTTVRAVYHSERRSVQLEVLTAICRALKVQPGDIFQVDQASATIEPPATGKEGHSQLPPGKKSGRDSKDTRQKEWREW